MKDALGHGSDARKGFAIQKLNPNNIGNPWQTVLRVRNQATAERLAQHARTDEPRPRKTLVRLK